MQLLRKWRSRRHLEEGKKSIQLFRFRKREFSIPLQQLALLFRSSTCRLSGMFSNQKYEVIALWVQGTSQAVAETLALSLLFSFAAIRWIRFLELKTVSLYAALVTSLYFARAVGKERPWYARLGFRRTSLFAPPSRRVSPERD
jgi:hypothetical protein